MAFSNAFSALLGGSFLTGAAPTALVSSAYFFSSRAFFSFASYSSFSFYAARSLCFFNSSASP
jgi:hypothetical protein